MTWNETSLFIENEKLYILTIHKSVTNLKETDNSEWEESMYRLCNYYTCIHY